MALRAIVLEEYSFFYLWTLCLMLITANQSEFVNEALNPIEFR